MHRSRPWSRFITRRGQIVPFAGSLGKPPELDENLRSALWMNEGPLGEVEVKGFESSFFSSSLSFGEKAAPNGLWASRGDVALGLEGPPLRLDCDGGVEPEENFELKLDIHEFLRPPTGLGALFCATGEGVAGFCSFCSAGLSSVGGFGSVLSLSFWELRFGSELVEETGRAGLLLERDRRREVGGAVGESLSAVDLSLTIDETDFVRDR